MSDKKVEKKRQKLKDRILELETNLKSSLGKKTHNSSEVSVADITTQLTKLRTELSLLK
jgi:hypothetical protein